MLLRSRNRPLGGQPPPPARRQTRRAKWYGMWIFFIATYAFGADPSPTQLRQFTVTDRQTGLTWLRCSVGQRWNGFRCIGVPRMLTWEQANEAAAMARAELDGNWRLPTVDELQTLVCESCPPPKLHKKLFPDTPAAPFWTVSEAPLSVGRMWTVNFYTGHLFARNTKSMERYVRLVKSAPPKKTKSTK